MSVSIICNTLGYVVVWGFEIHNTISNDKEDTYSYSAFIISVYCLKNYCKPD